MFSKTVEYALRAVVFLAQHLPDPQKTSDIAGGTKVPQAYLSKVLQSLRAGGVVQMQRGIGGGVRLVKSPEELMILEVVNAVEPIQRIETCPLGLKGHGKNLCALHHKMDKAIEVLEDSFRSTSLADLLADPNPSVPLVDGRKTKKQKKTKS